MALFSRRCRLFVLAKDSLADAPTQRAEDSHCYQRDDDHKNAYDDTEMRCEYRGQRTGVETAYQRDTDAEEQTNNHTQAAAQRAPIDLALRFGREGRF